MNSKQLTLLIILGLILGGGGFWVMKNRQSTYTTADDKMGAKLLGDFDINSVSTIRILNASNEVNLTKSGDAWTVKERNGYPANFETLSRFMVDLWDMKITKQVNVGPSRLGPLELIGPDQQGPATLVEFIDASGKTTRSLLLGAKHMREGGSSPMGPMGGSSSWPDGRYIMVDGQQEQIALVSDPLTQAEPRVRDWLNKDMFKVEKPKSIAVTQTNASDSWTIARESESGTWTLMDAQGDEKLDTSKSSSVTSALSYPSFNDVATNSNPEEVGIGKGISATLTTFEDFTYTINVGDKTSDDNYYMTVKVTADIPTERTPGEDEKEEDKEKLDKEFTDKITKLKEKLEKEKACEKWIYLVSKWTIDPLLKIRKDLLEEKKEEETPAEEMKTDVKAGAMTPEAELDNLLPALPKLDPIEEIKAEIKRSEPAKEATPAAATTIEVKDEPPKPEIKSTPFPDAGKGEAKPAETKKEAPAPAEEKTAEPKPAEPEKS